MRGFVLACAIPLAVSPAPRGEAAGGEGAPDRISVAAAADERTLLGVIRWDNWQAGNPYDRTIADAEAPQRIPYYVARGRDGRLAFPGSSRAVLDADVHYARSAGIDYFLFGYYLESDAWGRSIDRARRLNEALRSYRALPDRLGVRYALSFNLSFPVRDVPKVAAAVAEALRGPDYVAAGDGSAPVFFLVGSMTGWLKGLGGRDAAREALSAIRREVKAATGRDVHAVALMFDFRANDPVAHDVGFDAVGTYATAVGSGDRSIPYAQCAELARNGWAFENRHGSLGFLPTVTMGWDYRPALRDPRERKARSPTPDWCEPATDAQWTEQIRAALAAAAANPRNDRFRSVLFYAWNEFSEGGWVAPTIGEGTRRIGVIADAVGRHPAMPAFRLTWPVEIDPKSCDVGPSGRAIAPSDRSCDSPADAVVRAWPCPPRMRIGEDLLVRAPPDSEPEMPTIRQRRTCVPE